MAVSCYRVPAVPSDSKLHKLYAISEKGITTEILIDDELDLTKKLHGAIYRCPCFYCDGSSSLLRRTLAAPSARAPAEIFSHFPCGRSVSSDPISAYPEPAQPRVESAEEEKQAQDYEKDGEREDEP